MIVNFITDSYLERFFPDILNYKAGGQIDYATQIALATEGLLDDLVARNITPRNCMVPIDLNRDSDATEGIQQLTQLSAGDLTFVDSYYYSDMKEGTNQRRAFLNVSAKADGDSWRWTLVGSNAKDAPDDTSDDSCEDILTFEYLENDEASDKNQTFLQEYKWYGFCVEKVIGLGSFTFRCALYETVYDRLIAYKALELIASSWKTGANQRWDERRDDMRKEYETLLETIRINLDNDEDGVPEKTEAGKKVGATIGSISLIG